MRCVSLIALLLLLLAGGCSPTPSKLDLQVTLPASTASAPLVATVGPPITAPKLAEPNYALNPDDLGFMVNPDGSWVMSEFTIKM